MPTVVHVLSATQTLPSQNNYNPQDLFCTKMDMAFLCAAKIFASECAKFIKQKSLFSVWIVFFTTGLVAAVPLSLNVLQGGFLTLTKAI